MSQVVLPVHGKVAFPAFGEYKHLCANARGVSSNVCCHSFPPISQGPFPWTLKDRKAGQSPARTLLWKRLEP